MASCADLGLQFVERCSVSDAATAADDFRGTIRRMGFTGTACGAWTGIGKNRRNRFFFVGWPADWLELHNRNGCFEHDLLPIEARWRTASFIWSEIIGGKLARAVWERCRVSEGFGLYDPERVKLSPREIECLQWAAAGKSDVDIASLVGIKPATAHFHIEQAKKRLGVKTRVEAVAVGVLNGVI